MAKSQRRSSREIRKPKATKAPIVALSSAPSDSPVTALMMRKPKGKL